MTKTIDIDGSLGEGGGQVLRTSLALSLITGKSFHLRNVRAKRAKPGLQAQHLKCVLAAAEIGAATVRGASLQSTDLTFEPGEVNGGDYHFKIGTAGATTLVLHTVYLPLALAGAVRHDRRRHAQQSARAITSNAPGRVHERLGIDIAVSLGRTGFYPRRRLVCAHRACNRVSPFQGMTTSKSRASILAGVASLPTHIAERMIEQVGYRLEKLYLEFDATIETWQGGPGCMIGIELPTTPAPTFLFALGEKGKPAEMVAHEAADQVEAYLNAKPLGVDEHSADQLLLPLALAEGRPSFASRRSLRT